MKGWIAKGAVLAVFVGAMVSAMPVSAEPSYECTLAHEGELFQVAYDHPVDPGYLYQCRGANWRLVGICSQSQGCPPAPDPGGPIVEM